MLLKIINVILILLLFCIANVYSQNLTEEEKQEIIQSLDYWMFDSIISANHSSYAIHRIIENRIIEAVPNLIANLWYQAPVDQYWSLYALKILGSSETETLTLAFIDSVNNYYDNLEFTDLDSMKYYYNKNTSPFSILKLKVMATAILFELNNYSTYNYVFEIIDENVENNRNSILLYEIIKHVPTEAERSKSELKRIAINGKNNDTRYIAAVNLVKIGGPDIVQFILQWLGNKYCDDIARSIVIETIPNYNLTNDVKTFLKEQLKISSSNIEKLSIIEVLIKKSGSLSDYKAVYNFINTEEDEFTKIRAKQYYNIVIPKPDSTISTSTLLDTLTSYTNQCYGYEWLKDETYKNELFTKLTNAKNYLSNGDSINCRTEVAAFQNSVNQVYQDSAGSYPKHVSNEGYKFLYYYAQYILDRLPDAQTHPYLKVNFKDSEGNFILNGSLQYYDVGWKDGVNNGDGTFNVETQKEKVSLRMNYEGASQQLDNVTVKQNTVTFSTVKTIVKLLNSQNSLIDGGTVQYYASGWKEFGTASNGEVTKELLPKEYSFRMNYGGASLDKSQNISNNLPVVFSTVNCTVRVVNNANQPINNAAASYYASGWKTIGNTVNGEVIKELLPKNYSFRVNNSGVNKEKQQDITNNTVVEFVY